MRGVDDPRTRRRDEEAIIDKYHQSESMPVCVGRRSSARERASRRGRLTRTSERSGRAEGFHDKKKPESEYGKLRP